MAVYVIGVIGVTFYYGIEVTLNLGYDDWHFAVWSSFGIFLGTSIYALEGYCMRLFIPHPLLIPLGLIKFSLLRPQ